MVDVNHTVTLESYCQLNFTKDIKMFFLRVNALFLFVFQDFLEHFPHHPQFILIFSICEQPHHFLCALHCGIIVSVDSNLKN